MKITQTPISITCQDGVVLSGLLLIPEQPKAVIQFNTGTATKKEFYLSFLSYLATQGYVCCLWDYRGSGGSAPVSLKGCAYRFSDYGIKDMPAVKDFLTQHFPGLPFFIIGHSAGGQQLGFINDLSDVKGVICFAVSVGFHGYMPMYYRLQALFFFYLFSPVSFALKGYLDSKKFNIMEDLPKNVVKEWRDWCSKPDYLFDNKFLGKTIPKGKFKEYAFPIQVYWTPDDPISNKKTVAAYWKHIQNTSETNIKEVIPQNYQQKNIGHFGFFKKKMKYTLWKETLDKLDSWLA